jgi:hypothetical protein
VRPVSELNPFFENPHEHERLLKQAQFNEKMFLKILINTGSSLTYFMPLLGYKVEDLGLHRGFSAQFVLFSSAAPCDR